MKHFIQVTLAVICGFFLMWPLALVFNKFGWAVFHTWGLAHGSFLIAWPLLAKLTYWLLGLISWFKVKAENEAA
ncbi:MAG: hypothetical protein ACAH12_01560 [Methylophilaceae bacterium]